MSKKSHNAAMKRLLLRHVRRGREQHAEAVKKVERLGRLHNKLIYLCAAGKMPVEQVEKFDEAVASVLEEE